MTTALIIGGGIAGPVAAMALRRAGIEATVYEARPEPALDVGSWLGLQTNGLDALKAVGALEPVLDIGVPTDAIRFLDHRGRRLGQLPTGQPLPGGVPGRSVKRADLYGALRAAALSQGIRFEHGRKAVGVRNESSSVRALFDDGTSEQADLLIGADGIHSKLRTALNPGAPGPRYVPMINSGGYARLAPEGADPDILTMVFGRKAFAGYLVTPSGDTWWFVNPPRRREPAPDELAGISDAQWRTDLHDLYDGDASPLRDLIDATPGPLKGWTTYDLPQVPVWHDDRSVLIGDAAHAVSPSTGQGASLAMEDAVVLGLCLRDHPPAAAFARYAAMRRPRVEKVVAEGRKSSRLRSPGPLTRTLRNIVLPKVLSHAAGSGAESLAWMHNHHLEWDDATESPTTGSPTTV